MAWIYLDDHFPEHPKIEIAGGDAGWLFVCILGYCKRHGTRGRIPKPAALRVSDRKNPASILARMVVVELLIDDGDYYAVHNYDEWNKPQESRTEAARKAARVRWAKDKPTDASGNANASGPHNERMSEPPCEADASPCPMPLAPAPTGTSLSSSPTLVDHLTTTARREAEAHTDIRNVAAWVAKRVRSLTENLEAAFPGDHDRQLAEASAMALGPAPASARPSPLDDAQRAQYESMLGPDDPKPWLEPVPNAEERRRILDARRTG